MSHDEAVSVMFIDPRYTKRLSLFMRYKGQLDRAWRKALAELEKLIAARVIEEATQNKINSLIANRFVSSLIPEAPEGGAPEAPASALEANGRELIAES